jgi:hypothetical protein
MCTISRNIKQRCEWSTQRVCVFRMTPTRNGRATSLNSVEQFIFRGRKWISICILINACLQGDKTVSNSMAVALVSTPEQADNCIFSFWSTWGHGQVYEELSLVLKLSEWPYGICVPSGEMRINYIFFWGHLHTLPFIHSTCFAKSVSITEGNMLHALPENFLHLRMI